MLPVRVSHCYQLLHLRQLLLRQAQLQLQPFDFPRSILLCEAAHDRIQRLTPTIIRSILTPLLQLHARFCSACKLWHRHAHDVLRTNKNC